MSKFIRNLFIITLLFNTCLAIASDDNGVRNRRARPLYSFLSNLPNATAPLLDERESLLGEEEHVPSNKASSILNVELRAKINGKLMVTDMRQCSVPFLTSAKEEKFFEAANKGDLKAQKELINRANLFMNLWTPETIAKTGDWAILKEANHDAAIARYVLTKSVKLPWLDDNTLKDIIAMIELRVKAGDPQALLTYSDLLGAGKFILRDDNLALQCALEAGEKGEALGYFMATLILDRISESRAALRYAVVAADAGLAAAQYHIFVEYSHDQAALSKQPNWRRLEEPTSQWVPLPTGKGTLQLHPIYGMVGKLNSDIALKYLQMAADQGYPNALYDIGIGKLALAKDGPSRQKEYMFEAALAFTQAADLGHSDAMVYLAILSSSDGFFTHIRPFPKNTTKAIAWCNKAVKLGNNSGYVPIGYMYLNGNGVPMNKYVAASYLFRADLLENPDMAALAYSIFRYDAEKMVPVKDTSYEADLIGQVEKLTRIVRCLATHAPEVPDPSIIVLPKFTHKVVTDLHNFATLADEACRHVLNSPTMVTCMTLPIGFDFDLRYNRNTFTSETFSPQEKAEFEEYFYLQPDLSGDSLYTFGTEPVAQTKKFLKFKSDALNSFSLLSMTQVKDSIYAYVQQCAAVKEGVL